MSLCPLCLKSSRLKVITGPDVRVFMLCENCNLIHTDTRNFLSAEKEKERYLNNKNSITDKAYVKFLGKAMNTALPLLTSEMRGLDFGCGPVPTLSLMLSQNGINCEDYDPVFFPELDPTTKFDFIFATESFEHFFNPAKEMHKIANLLTDDGFLIILTEPWLTVDKFKTWFYARNQTHVSFYHSKTFEFIAQKMNMQLLESTENRVFILRKNKVAPETEAIKIEEESALA